MCTASVIFRSESSGVLRTCKHTGQEAFKVIPSFIMVTLPATAIALSRNGLPKGLEIYTRILASEEDKLQDMLIGTT